MNCAFDVPRPTPGIITTRPTTLSTVDELAPTTRQRFTRAPATSRQFTRPPTSAVTQPQLVTEARQTMSTDKGMFSKQKGTSLFKKKNPTIIIKPTASTTIKISSLIWGVAILQMLDFNRFFFRNGCVAV